MPSTSTTVITDESCPGCGRIDGVQQTTTTDQVTAWECTCGLSWVTSVINPHLRADYLNGLAAAAQDVQRLRWLLRQIVTLADCAPGLTDEHLRTRLTSLAESYAR
jgi:hypothetical protein